jgi:hypothetical protein
MKSFVRRLDSFEQPCYWAFLMWVSRSLKHPRVFHFQIGLSMANEALRKDWVHFHLQFTRWYLFRHSFIRILFNWCCTNALDPSTHHLWCLSSLSPQNIMIRIEPEIIHIILDGLLFGSKRTLTRQTALTQRTVLGNNTSWIDIELHVGSWRV